MSSGCKLLTDAFEGVKVEKAEDLMCIILCNYVVTSTD